MANVIIESSYVEKRVEYVKQGGMTEDVSTRFYTLDQIK